MFILSRSAAVVHAWFRGSDRQHRVANARTRKPKPRSAKEANARTRSNADALVCGAGTPLPQSRQMPCVDDHCRLARLPSDVLNKAAPVTSHAHACIRTASEDGWKGATLGLCGWVLTLHGLETGFPFFLALDSLCTCTRVRHTMTHHWQAHHICEMIDAHAHTGHACATSCKVVNTLL